MSFTMNDLALLLIALIVGWLLGLMMSGRGKYKRLWRDEQIAHRPVLKERDGAIRERDARIEAANARIAELERHSGPIGPGTATAVGGAVHGRDDLSRITGLTQAQEVALNEAGYHRYGQIAGLSAEQEATLEARLGLKHDRARRLARSGTVARTRRQAGPAGSPYRISVSRLKPM